MTAQDSADGQVKQHEDIVIGRGALAKTTAQLDTAFGRYIRKGQPAGSAVDIDVDELTLPEGCGEPLNQNGR